MLTTTNNKALTDTEILDRMVADAGKNGESEFLAELASLDDSEEGQKERRELIAAGRVIYG